jgi:hypothetical protein
VSLAAGWNIEPGQSPVDPDHALRIAGTIVGHEAHHGHGGVANPHQAGFDLELDWRILDPRASKLLHRDQRFDAPRAFERGHRDDAGDFRARIRWGGCGADAYRPRPPGIYLQLRRLKLEMDGKLRV